MKNREFEKKSVQIDGITISYRETKDGETIIFCLPSWPSDSTEFQLFVNAIGSEFKIIAMDNPFLENTFKEKFSMFAFLDLIDKLILKLNINEYILLGYSFGGIVSQLFVQGCSVSPRKIILISSPQVNVRISKRNVFLLELGLFLEKLIPDRLFLYFAKSYAKIYLNHLHTIYIEDISYIAYENFLPFIDRINLKNSLLALESIMKANRNYKVQEINIDTLHIFTDNDLEAVEAFGKLAESQIQATLQIGFTDIQERIIHGLDHNHFALQPRESVKMIKTFLLE